MTDLASAWARVDAEAARLKPVHLRTLFANDPDRFARFSAHAVGLLVDYSKEKLDAEAMQALLALAEAAGVPEKRDAMFRGDAINATEGRAVLHTALRAPEGADIRVDGENVVPVVREVLDRFLTFAEAVRSGEATGATGKAFTDVVNIGIGGSDLGPVMATLALSAFHDGPRVHFVSNVDGTHMADTLRGLDPETTLFIVASKTFTTQETMTNAGSARDWAAKTLGEAVGENFAAVSTNLAATAAFGIDDSRVFGFWDWVGGRYSMWSAIGLPVAIAIGAERFRELLSGAHAMDAHFRNAPLAGNLPILLGLIGVWRRNGLGIPTHAMIPYEQRLARLPAYTQQLDMESNGKSTRLDGDFVDRETGGIVWGEAGTNSQHSFFQLLHQGTDPIATDFLIAAEPVDGLPGHHALLAANCFAQSQALAFGKTTEEAKAELAEAGTPADKIDWLAAHKTYPGDRPSTTILYRRLDPATLGALVALQEHRVFVEGAIWGINSFDQWGVELGKALAKNLVPALKDGAALTGADASTAGLVAAWRALGEA